MCIIITLSAAVIWISVGMVIITGAHKSLARVPTISVRPTGIGCARACTIVPCNNNFVVKFTTRADYLLVIYQIYHLHGNSPPRILAVNLHARVRGIEYSIESMAHT